MACGCQSRGQTQYMVRLNGGTVYTSTSRVNAAKVHEKYLQTAPSARLVEVPAGSTVEAEERKQV